MGAVILGKPKFEGMIREFCRNTSAGFKILWKRWECKGLQGSIVYWSFGALAAEHTLWLFGAPRGSLRYRQIQIGSSAAVPTEPTRWLSPIWKSDINVFPKKPSFPREVRVLDLIIRNRL